MNRLDNYIHANNLARDIGSALKTRRYLNSRRRDVEFRNNGGEIIYALDSTVFNLRFRETDIVGKQEKYRSAASIFRGPRGAEQNAYLFETFSQILVQYLFNGSSEFSRHPFILLPGHKNEINNTYDRLINAFLAQSDTKVKVEEDLLTYLRKLGGFADPISRQTFAQSQEETIYKLLYKLEEPHEKVRLFHSLLRAQRFLPMEAAPAITSWKNLRNPDTNVSIFLDTKLHKKTFPVERLADWWSKNLLNVYDKDNLYLPADEAAFSTLTRMNLILKHYNTRVVLFTTSEHLIKLGTKYKPLKYSNVSDWNSSFSDLYLRHPNCLLEDDEFMRPVEKTDANSEKFSSWLDFFINRTTGLTKKTINTAYGHDQHLENYAGILLQLAQNALTQNPTIHEDLYSKWLVHLENVTFAHGSTSTLARKEFARKVNSEFENELNALDRLNEYVLKLTFDSWRDFMSSVTDLGYEMLLEANEQKGFQKRTVPGLYLRGSIEIKKISDLINKASGAIESRKDLLKLIKISKTKLKSASGSYVEALCYGYLFAHAGKWDRSKLLAQRAVYLAKSKFQLSDGDEGMEPISGREAYYLLAVSTKHTARSKIDIELAKSAIEEGLTALEEEQKIKKGKVTGLRLSAETVALDLASLLFDYFPENDIENVNSTIPSSNDLLGIMKSLKNLLRNKGDCKNERIKTQVSTCLLCNFMTATALLARKRDLEMATIADLRAYSKLYSRDLVFLQNDPSASGSISILDIVMMNYGFQFRKNLTKFEADIVKEFERFKGLSRKEQNKLFIMPFDRKRYDFLIDSIGPPFSKYI